MIPTIQRFLQRSRRQNRLSTMGAIFSLGILVALLSMAIAACGSSVSGQGNTPSPGPLQKCGNVQGSLRGTIPNPSGAKQAEDCFWQAFQKCQPASLVYTAVSVDTVATRTFTIKNNGTQCSVTDAFQNEIVPQKPFAPKTYICSGVTQLADGLHFSSCGDDGDVIVPAQ
jgi:hypothetical protein